MTRNRKILAWVLGIPLALLALLILVLATFDWNRLKPTINEKVATALHRPFAIQGDLGVAWHRETDQGGWRAWVPWPHIAAEDVELGNPNWAKEPVLVHLDRVQARVSPLALLSKQVFIPRIDLVGPVINAQRLADGRNSWTFDDPSTPKEPKESQDQKSAWTVDIGTIGFDAGRVSFDDAQTGTRVKAQVTSLDAPVAYADLVGKNGTSRQRANVKETQPFQFALTVDGTYKQVPVSGKGQIGGLLALQDADQPFPVQLDARAGNTHVKLFGTLMEPKRLGALDLHLVLEGKSLDDLYPLTGVTLPETAPYSTDGHLVVKLNEPEGARFSYEGFNGRVGKSDLHGNVLFVSSKPRAKLSGELTSNQLLFEDLAPLIGADTKEQQAAKGETTQQPANKALPVSEFKTDRWRTMDADVRFSGKRIVQSAKLPITDLNTHVRLTDGVLLLDPLRFGIAGGDLNTTVRLEGDRTPMRGKVDLHVRRVKLNQLFPTVETMKRSMGDLNGDASLSGTGNSVAALLATSNGDLKILMSDGRISRGLMELAGLNVGNYLVNRLFGDDEVQINCAASDLNFKNGLVTPQVFVFDTENAVINVTGDVNLKSEALNLTVDPHSKGFRIFSLRSPLYVRGTLKNPSPGVKALPLAARGAVAALLATFAAPAAGLLALVAPSNEQGSQCVPLLRQMSAGR